MKTRMHPSIILERLVNSLLVIIVLAFYIVTQMLDDFSAENINNTISVISSLGFSTFTLGFIVIVLLLIVFGIFFFIAWKNTYLFFDNENLIIEKGKIFKQVTTIHLSDIATINITRNILEKILGTSNLKIDLNTSNSVTFKGKLVFKEDKAYELKNEILLRMGKDAGNKEEDFDSLIDYSSQDVFRHMLLSIDIVAILFIIIVYFIVLMGMMETSQTAGVIFTIIPILIIIVPLLWSVAKTYLSYFNFKAIRENNQIRLSYGALTTYKYNLPISKINAVIIRQTLQARILGYYNFEVVNAGISEQEEEKTIISLYIKSHNVNKVLEELIPEYQNTIVLQNQPKRALGHYLVAKILCIAISLVLIPFTNYFSLLLIPLIVLIALAQYKTKQIGKDDNLIIIADGILNKKVTLIKYSNIELVAIKQKLFSPIFGTKVLKINVVGPATNSSFESGLFDKNVVMDIAKQYQE